MKKIACLYFEGNDTKIVLFEQNDASVKLIKAASIESSQAFITKQNSQQNTNSGADDNILYYDTLSEEVQTYNNSYINKLNTFLKNENLKEYSFIPILTEPGLRFQKIESDKDFASLNDPNKKKKDRNKTLNFIELFDKSKMAIFPSGQINYLQAIDTLSKSNGIKFVKLVSVKCAEIALLNYLVNTKQIKKDSNSLIIYFGKEYTKLLFLKNENIAHIGATISVGKNHSKITNTIISKILFEREHAQLESPSEIFIFGEKVSDDFHQRLKETYKLSSIKYFELDPLIKIENNALDIKEISNYAVPIAAVHEYLFENNKKFKGIDLLPNHIRESQKQFQLAWHGIFLLLALFASVLFITFYFFQNKVELKNMDQEIKSLLIIEQQNKETVDKIAQLNEKVNSSEQTKMFLDQISSGTGQWSAQMEKLADFTGEYQNLWIKTLKMNDKEPLLISGYSTHRYILPVLKRTYPKSFLEFMHYLSMRDHNAYEFNIKFNTLNSMKDESKNKK